MMTFCNLLYVYGIFDFEPKRNPKLIFVFIRSRDVQTEKNYYKKEFSYFNFLHLLLSSKLK